MQLLELLAELQLWYGDFSLHRIRPTAEHSEVHLLAAESMSAMLPAEVVVGLEQEGRFTAALG